MEQLSRERRGSAAKRSTVVPHLRLRAACMFSVWKCLTAKAENNLHATSKSHQDAHLLHNRHVFSARVMAVLQRQEQHADAATRVELRYQDLVKIVPSCFSGRGRCSGGSAWAHIVPDARLRVQVRSPVSGSTKTTGPSTVCQVPRDLQWRAGPPRRPHRAWPTLVLQRLWHQVQALVHDRYSVQQENIILMASVAELLRLIPKAIPLGRDMFFLFFFFSLLDV